MNEAIKFVWVKGHGWRYACNCLDERLDYDLSIEQFETNEPHSHGHTWRRQLLGKSWFNEGEFDYMLARFYQQRQEWNKQSNRASATYFPMTGDPIKMHGHHLDPAFKAGQDC